MKLSQQTLALLKNFSAINSNIFIKAGSKIQTLSVVGNALASATVEEEFERDISIYDLGELLSVLNIAPDGDVTLSENYLTVKWNRSKVKYAYADTILMRDAVAAAEKQVKFPETDVEFTLTSEMLVNIHKSSSILKAGYLSVFSENGKVALKVFDKGNINSNSFIIDVDVETNLDFEAILDITNLKLLAGNYNVSISKRNISRFVNVDQDVTYYLTLDVSSSFK